VKAACRGSIGLAGLALKGGSMQEVLQYALASMDAASRQGLLSAWPWTRCCGRGLMEAAWIVVARFGAGSGRTRNFTIGAGPRVKVSRCPRHSAQAGGLLSHHRVMAAFIILATSAPRGRHPRPRQVIAAVAGGSSLAP
jgi:hypothetical protein